MRFKKVLLVNPFYSSKVYAIPVLPAGLGYISQVLESHGIEHDVFDMALGYDYKDLKEKIISFSPDLIGIGLMTYRYNNIYSLISRLKNDFSNIKIVCGGAHITNFKERALNDCASIDYGVTFEGELTLLDLVRGAPLDKIKGLIYRNGADLLYNGQRDFIEDLDRLPFPKYDKFELKKYSYGISIVTSRGCPYSCVYCSCHILGKKIRFRSAGNVIEELKYWHKRGIREFGLQEDNPTFNKQRMSELCTAIESEDLDGVMLMCGNGVRADRVDFEILAKMKKAGFKRLAFGVEAGNDRILQNIKKGQSFETIENAVKMACDLGFYVSLFFLIGSPGETIDDVRDSIRFSLKYPVGDVKFNNLVPIPGTELFEWVRKNDYFIMPPEKYLNMDPPAQLSNLPVFSTPEFSAFERKSALKEARRAERLVRRKLLEKRLPAYLGINRIIAAIYVNRFVSKIENWLLSYPKLRSNIGILRMKIRKHIYAG
ncbi:MAG: radical SAM protein [Candidatus Omnitrophota bacterium]|jgi:radical SAM superfamily enzyme YgiQ (UPF0313 family)|nr:MAG: radical SAM protein [Candidatus Omnitrophota bacterium]